MFCTTNVTRALALQFIRLAGILERAPNELAEGRASTLAEG